ncbi:MAG: hypothetical protein GXO74_13120 [Calditrichaeota bacterium]|nr:hypothetical protein [Calditrichota bacterium]
MKTQSIDTHPEAEKVQIELLRKMSFSDKFYLVMKLSETAMKLSKRAIARANKDLNEEQVNLLFIEYHYGKDLADRVRKAMEEGKSKKK